MMSPPITELPHLLKKCKNKNCTKNSHKEKIIIAERSSV